MADYARVKLTYVIGREDVLLNVSTLGTGDQRQIESWVRGAFPLDIGSAIERFGLRSPDLYRKVADAGHFYRKDFPWELPSSPV